MTITSRAVLSTLTKPELVELTRGLGIAGFSLELDKKELLDLLVSSTRLDLSKALLMLAFESLKLLCRDLSLDADGRSKATLVNHLVAAMTP